MEVYVEVRHQQAGAQRSHKVGLGTYAAESPLDVQLFNEPPRRALVGFGQGQQGVDVVRSRVLLTCRFVCFHGAKVRMFRMTAKPPLSFRRNSISFSLLTESMMLMCRAHRLRSVKDCVAAVAAAPFFQSGHVFRVAVIA